MKELVIKLQSIGAIKFGSFEIKKDFLSPFQIDLSMVLSHPAVAKTICHYLSEKAKYLSFDLLSGVPMMGACFANFIAWEHELPLALRRSEAKPLSAKIIGSYKSGQRCLVIQDLQLWGQHTLDMIDDLEEEGLKVGDVLTLIDFEVGGKKKIKARGFISHSLLKASEVLQILSDAGKIGGDQLKLAMDFLENS